MPLCSRSIINAKTMSHNQITLANEIGQAFPSMPIEFRSRIAVWAGIQNRVGNTSLMDRAGRAVQAFVRHNMTGYDKLMDAYGFTKLQAREAVRREVFQVLNLWKA